jgi:sodium-dependent dicarboxylate transporter 2/3/5
VALLLAIPFAANLGGIGTPWAPPEYHRFEISDRTGRHQFRQVDELWSPYVIIMILICWGMLVKMFRPKQKTMHLSIAGTF